MAVAPGGQPLLSDQLAASHVGTRDDLEVTRQKFFSETSYVVRDPVTFDGHNLSPTDYEIFTNLTDEKPLSEVCEKLIASGVFEESEKESFYHFVVELQKRNLLNLPVTDSEMLFQQYQSKLEAKSKGLLMKVLFLKIPLGCPDRFLRSTYHLATFFFTKIFFTVWLCGLIAAISIVISHWSEFTSELGSALVFSNLPIMLGVTAGLKLWHELGHGYACRHYGVSVPSAGILLMIGTPLAFMDATGSWSLNKKYQRQIINLAGMYFELMLTIIAAFVWVLVDDSFVRSICNFTMLISSITTIACNVNPLMKYDGYFVMADALGIPNLKARASFAIQGFYKYVFFRLPMPPCESRTLRVILLTYGFCAGLYKISLSIGIAAMIAMQVWLVGLAIGVYYTVTSLGTMVLQLGKYLIWSTEIQNQRKLAITYLLILALVIPAAILCVPIPGRAQARGVVEPRPLTVIHANNAGFVKELLVKAGDQIEKGRMITKFENLDRDRERQLKQAELKGLLVKYRRYRNEDRVQAAKAEKEIEQTQFELSSLRSLNPNDLIESPLPGTIITRLPPLQIGQYVSPGEEIVRIGGDGRVVKAVVNASSIATIQPKLGQTVHCRFLAQSESVIDGTIRSISASGNKVVPYEALTHLAGGFIPVSGESMEATEPFFEMEIELSESVPQEILKNGMVCDIRFGENYETVGSHVYRSLLRFHNQIRMSY